MRKKIIGRVALVSALPVVVAYILLTRQFVAGISAGAIKG